MARARTDLVSGVDSAARPEDYRVGASEEIPGTLEAQGEHENAEKHQLLVALDQAVTQYSLPKNKHAQPEPSHAVDHAVRVTATPKIGATPDTTGQSG